MRVAPSTVTKGTCSLGAERGLQEVASEEASLLQGSVHAVHLWGLRHIESVWTASPRPCGVQSMQPEVGN